jgi:hypothetical protein
MVLNTYAQINGAGVCVGLLETSGSINAPHMIAVEGYDLTLIGKRWTGTAWEAVTQTEAEAAARELTQIDQATGMSRTLREALIAIAGKTGADVAYLAAQEAKAATARAKIPKV